MSVTTIKHVSVISDAFGTMAVRVLGMALVFATTVASANVLGPLEYGAFNAGLSLTLLLASLLPMGTDRILARNLAMVRTPGEAGVDIALAHMSSLLAATCLFVLATCQRQFAAVMPIPDLWLQTSMLAVVMVVPVTLTNLRQRIALPLIGTRLAVLPEQTLVPIVFLSVLGVAFARGIPMTASSTAWTYAVIGMIIWCVSLLTPSLHGAYLSAARSLPKPQQLASYVRSAVPFLHLSVGCMLLQRCLPLITVLTCGFTETGQFAVAQQLAGLPTIPLGVATLVILPRWTRQFRTGQMQAVSGSVRDAATLSFVMALLIALTTWLATPFLPYLFGGSYARVQEILPTLLLVAIVESVSGPSMAVMQAMNMEHSLARSILGFIPIQLGLVYGFSHWLGLEGAAFGLLLSRILWITMVVGIIYRSQRIVSLPSLCIHSPGIHRIAGRQPMKLTHPLH